MQSLAIKYRPTDFSALTEQDAIKTILTQQLANNEIKNAYLMCGSQGVGKTTIGRIFANEINKGQGHPIELDAASHNSVDDVREIIQQAKTKSLDSEYKCFLIDECHSISSSGWQAFLKILEEPPAKSIFIFCTTDAQKIPKTILSRVQRFNFQKISQKGIVNRLNHVLTSEGIDVALVQDGIEYVAKLAEGGMRDALTLLDKCLAYSTDLSLENVIKALGTTDYDTLFDLTDCIYNKDTKGVIDIVEKVHMSGKDIKQFVKTYVSFILDLLKYNITNSFDYLQLPNLYADRLKGYTQDFYAFCQEILTKVVQLNADIKWETNPKVIVETTLMMGALRQWNS